MPWSTLKSLVGRTWDARAWRPEHARLLWSQLIRRSRNADAHLADRDHLLAAASWLGRAQDATPDGGVCGRYGLAGGWTSTYPETTGYIIPTFLALADHLGDDGFRERARRAVACLLALQLPDGAFPGGEVHENRSQPSVFNTAQILSGLVAWWRATGDTGARDAARRGADWLVGAQDADGAWRKHVYRGVATTYSAHASCWLAEFGAASGDTRYLDAAGRHLDWVLAHQDPTTEWFDLAGFTPDAHAARQAYTHTIAYTLWGVLLSSEVLGRGDGIAAVERAAIRIARRLELSGWLPGILDHQWRPGAGFACLTGNAQMALIWFRLHQRSHHPVLLNAALKALDLVLRAQPMFAREPGIRGGIPGSDPVWGEYLYNALPNWAAKYVIDALLEKQRVLAQLTSPPRGRWQVPQDVPTTLPQVRGGGRTGPRALRVVLYTSPDSPKVAQMATAWEAWGFLPTAVIVERRPAPGLLHRLRHRVRERGLGGVLRRALVALRRGASAPRATGRSTWDPSWPDPLTYCATRHIPTREVSSLASPMAVALVAELKPDLAIHAGAGILRAPLLAVPRLGTLNAHMGALPYYRGMNVTEWTSLNGDAIACTVHLVDPGIDTGPIVCVAPVDPAGATGIAELRGRVDRAQVALLGDVVRFVAETGTLPPVRTQRAEEGVQFFRMHPDLAALLEAGMRDGPPGAQAVHTNRSQKMV